MNIDGKSLDIAQDNLAKLKRLFPNLVKEGKIDLNELKATFGQEAATAEERYGLSWAGKYDSFKQVQEQTTHTLIPDRENSIAFDQTENIFIEGENLDALRILQKSYYGKIKMIYIDPPYNTGNDHFIYPDKYAESKEEYLQRTGAKNEQGYLNKANLFRKNSRENGQFHSVWLSMIYPRLYLARNLLREDGVIFVSIDDNEAANLRLLMDEVFGEENFVDCVIWKKRYGGGAKEKYLITLHEYVLIYAKNSNELPKIFIPLSEKSIKRYYKSKDANLKTRGPYRTHPLEATKSMGERKNLVYPIPAPDGAQVIPKRQWLWSKERTLKALENGELEFVKSKDNGWTVHTKQYLKGENGEVRKDKPFSIIDDVYTQHGTNEIIKLFGNAQIFSFPKPSVFIRTLINIGLEDKSGIVLDFFPGSGTTAHAVLDLNKEDGGNRKFICIQLPEETPEGSPARNAGYNTIAAIGRARIRKVIDKMNAEREAQLALEERPVLGFRSFTLAPSNFKIWRGDVKLEAEMLAQLEIFQQPAQSDDEEAMLWELLLKAGYALSTAIETRQVADAALYFINGGELIIALQAINQAVIEFARQSKPNAFICLDKLFNDDDQLKTNTSLQFKEDGIIFKAI